MEDLEKNSCASLTMEETGLTRYPGVVTNTISTKTTNLDALKAMTEKNLDALVVIDEERD